MKTLRFDSDEATIYAVISDVDYMDAPGLTGPAYTMYLAGWTREGEWRREVSSPTLVVRPMGGRWMWCGETLPGVRPFDYIVDGDTPEDVASRIAGAWREVIRR